MLLDMQAGFTRIMAKQRKLGDVIKIVKVHPGAKNADHSNADVKPVIIDRRNWTVEKR